MTHEKLISGLLNAASRSEYESDKLAAEWKRTKDHKTNAAAFTAARYAYRARNIAHRLIASRAIRTTNIPF